MISLQIVCVVLVAVSGRAEVQDHSAAETIYREAVASPVAHPLSSGISISAHSGPHVSHGGPVVSHPGPVVSHGGPVVSHAAPSVTHVGPVVSHGTKVSHAGPVVSHAGPVVNHAGPVVSHAGPVVSHAGPVVSHAGPVVSHAGPVVSHAGPVVSHGAKVSHEGPVSHAGPVVNHAGPVVSYAVPNVAHSGPVSHGGPVVVHAKGHVGKAAVVHDAPAVHVPVAHAPVKSYESGYYEPVRSQYHAQDGYGQYSFGYNAGASARDESRDAYGNVRGSFSYVDSYGNIQTQHYVAGKGGFQVQGTNLPVEVSHDHRYKRSYATFPASTGPIVGGIPSGHVTTVTRHVPGPVVVGHQGVYGEPYGYGGAVVYQPHAALDDGVVHAKAYGVSHLLGKAHNDNNFDKLSYKGFSYAFETGPSSLTTYGTHYDQHNTYHPY